MQQPRIAIFGPIDDQTVNSVQQQLSMRDRTQRLVVEINSDGGSVQEGITVYNLLRQWPAGVTTEVAGWACSIASLIALAGDIRLAHETALLMVHAPWASTSGNATALRTTAALLDQVKNTMMTAYRRTGRTDREISEWLSGGDHWFTAHEARLLGLVTEIIGEDVRASAMPAYAQASNLQIPAHLLLAQLQRNFAMTTTTSPAPQSASSPTAAPHDVEAIRAEGARLESKRRADIGAKFRRFTDTPGAPELLAACERDHTCTVSAAGDKLLALLGKDSSPIAGHYVAGDDIYTGGDAGRISEFCAAARDTLLARAGMPVADPHPGARDLRRSGIVSMAERLLSMGGRSVRDMSPAALISAALGTGDFPALLANTAGKSLAIGYDESPAGHALFTAEREVSDFKQKTLLSLSEAPDLLEVPELSEYRHGYVSDSASTFQLTTWGRIMTISRQALVNDDLEAFTLLPRAFGAAARRKEADKVFGTLTENANLIDGNPLFHAMHGNLGSAAALSVDSLGAARATMRKQMGAASLGYLDPMPKWLIVPVALETKAEQLLASMVDPSKSNDTPQLEWIRRLQLVADPRLDVNSATAWYLAASPKQIEGILRAYLAGEQRPHLEESTEFKNDAISYKVRLDFASGVVSYQALYKNPGA